MIRTCIPGGGWASALRRRRCMAGSAHSGAAKISDFRAQDQLQWRATDLCRSRMAASRRRLSARSRSAFATASLRSQPAAPARSEDCACSTTNTLGILNTPDPVFQEVRYFELRAEIPVGRRVGRRFGSADDGGGRRKVDIMEGSRAAAGRHRDGRTLAHTRPRSAVFRRADIDFTVPTHPTASLYGVLWQPDPHHYFIDRQPNFESKSVLQPIPCT